MAIREVLSPKGRFGPLEADHPAVGTLCPGCGEALKVGDCPALVNGELVDDDERAKAEAGVAHIVEAQVAHERCAHPEVALALVETVAELSKLVHKAEPPAGHDDTLIVAVCRHCPGGVPIHRVPGGHGPTWVHTETGAVAAAGAGRQLTGGDLIYAERARQISEEGWTHEHDDEHVADQLRFAAACYAEFADLGADCPPPTMWPWHRDWWKPSDDPVRNLVKAGALIAAEIDRLLRLADAEERSL